MMEGLVIRNSRLVNCFIICLLILSFKPACAQEDFVSIRCCADSNVIDPITNISWITDIEWYPDRSNCQDVTRRAAQNNTVGYGRVRIFSSQTGNNKWCYNLTTVKNQDYLIRGTFISEGTPSKSVFSFNVLIGTTLIGTVNSSFDTEVEGVFKAAGDYIDFCIEKDAKMEEGDPYISKLELRPLGNSDYLMQEESSGVLKLIERVDVGSNELKIRYPYDRYDRIWRKELHTNQEANRMSSTAANTNNTESTTPPIQVLQTALTHPVRLVFLHNDLVPGDNNYNLHLYFLELDDSVQMGQRVFDIFINDEKRQENIDILAGNSNYKAALLNFSADGFLNLTLVKASNESRLGPVISAYEIFQVHPSVQGTAQKDGNRNSNYKAALLNFTANGFLNLTSVKASNGSQFGPIISAYKMQVHLSVQETAQYDVNVITEVRNELMGHNQNNEVLKTWSGDPCYPISWHGLYCEAVNNSLVITILDLSHNDLTGNIPGSLISLPYLKTLKEGKRMSFSPHCTKLNILRATSVQVIVCFSDGKCGSQGSSHAVHQRVIGAVAGVCSLLAVAVAIFVICFYRKKRKFDSESHPMPKNLIFSLPSIDDLFVKSISIENFTLESIKAATQNYKTLIGEGGFGAVYRGTLPDGQDVAVKVRSATSTQGTREFDNELNLLSAIRHGNLVPLLGYCCENDQQILVYPFMSNGSLQECLYGLTYLHTFAGRCVIHRDVKSSNILLDQSMCAKVADFGFSKYAPQEGDSGVSLEVRGTAGYLDPEYYSTHHLSAKSDVFSFGIVLLEMITGREPLNIHRPRNEWSLVEWAKPFIRNSRIDEIVDPSIKGGYHAEAMWRVVEVALACIENFSANRPCMVDIVRELEDALIIENNSSEYMNSISFGVSNGFSIERTIIHPPPTTPAEESHIPSQPAPPQPR
ncbi:hypothetical protein RHMOL_Rhmol10G0101500 [Rhododendron molle]|uniref:Uncharacterized protein n=1 Tax=Rhododendron molle TaxID=49168 RepID=A0ACC0M1W5_RHOML|nr:hypothetical protein RHMOL_Rhmol10G0101500 [Rhododendron molle]